MDDTPLQDRQELLDTLTKQYGKAGAFIVAINDILYQYALDGGLPYYETDMEAIDVAKRLNDNKPNDIADIETIIVEVYQMWFSPNSLAKGVPKPALEALAEVCKQYLD